MNSKKQMISPHRFSTVKSNIQHFCCSSPLWSRESHFQMSASSVFGKNHLTFGLFGYWKLGGSFAGKEKRGPRTVPKKLHVILASQRWCLLEQFPPNISAEHGNMSCDSFELLQGVFWSDTSCFSKTFRFRFQKVFSYHLIHIFYTQKNFTLKRFPSKQLSMFTSQPCFCSNLWGICSPSQKHTRPNAMFSQ